MPEGPEIRRAADALAAVLTGRKLVHAEYRVPGLVQRGKALAGKRVRRVHARGKALLIDFEGGLSHYSHNQLYGEWGVTPGPCSQDERRTVRVVLASATHTATLYAATQITLLRTRDVEQHPYIARLGPDALDRATSVAIVRAQLVDARFAKRTLGSLLLDQSFVAGLGNYLRSDILFAAGLHADLRPRDLGTAQRAALARAILRIARRSYRTGGITNEPGRAQDAARQGSTRGDYRFLVYGREGDACWTCGRAIVRREHGGRGLFECGTCQSA